MSKQLAIPAERIVSFGLSISLGMKNYFQFEGRSSRGAYWYFTLAIILVSIVATLIDAVVFTEMFNATDGNGPISAIFSILTIIPVLSLNVRRLHDIGRGGWWILLAFTIIGLIPLIYWTCQPGNRSENRFGPDLETGR